MFYQGNEIKIMRAYGKMIQAVYAGTKLVWQAIRSCFGAGYWRGDRPWIGEDAWRKFN